MSRMLPFLLLCLSLNVFAQEIPEDQNCDPDTQDCSDTEPVISDPVDNIYPFKPFSTQRMRERIEALTENKKFLWSIEEMHKRNLEEAKTKEQPWAGSFWPLNQGLVANNYQDKDYKTFVFTLMQNVSWQTNANKYDARTQNIHPYVDELNEYQLARLSPAEKYDVLLGDKTFDFTNRIWAYTKKWGEQKRYGFLSKIDMPDNYHLPKVSKLMALWEGICHGWAIAAGHSPRPEKTVWVTLPNGNEMPFYPHDIKALVSIMWANSTIQSDVIFEGNRCNRKRPAKDKYGRYIDLQMDNTDTELIPRCADVHPGIFHTAMINILGVEGRSFVVDQHAEAAVGNQPVAGYSYSYFNPMTGKVVDFEDAIVSLDDYENDPFYESRNPEAKKLIGIDMNLDFVNWVFPNAAQTDAPEFDEMGKMKFRYDLELNERNEIVGGQWRIQRNGKAGAFKKGSGQPDFFWVVPKNWKNYFTPKRTVPLPEWNIEKNAIAPKEYADAAKIAHSFIYEESAYFMGGVSPKCPVFSDATGEKLMVNCEFRYPKPQPLIEVVNKLLDLSRK